MCEHWFSFLCIAQVKCSPHNWQKNVWNSSMLRFAFRHSNSITITFPLYVLLWQVVTWLCSLLLFISVMDCILSSKYLCVFELQYAWANNCYVNISASPLFSTPTANSHEYDFHRNNFITTIIPKNVYLQTQCRIMMYGQVHFWIQWLTMKSQFL